MNVSAASGRRWLVAVAVACVPAVLVLGFGHRGVHAARSMLVPGGGLIEVNLGLALSFAVLATAATIAWLRWGVDWVVLVVVVTSMALSSVLASAGHHPDATTRAAHEFPLVVLVVGMVGWSRAVLGRVPGFRWIGGRRVADTDERSLRDLAPVDRCRAVALLSLAGAAGPDARAAIREPDVVRRARRVGFAARLRCGGDPFRVDHAHARAALALTGQLDSAAMDRFAADASRSRGGVPASEPGWIRTLDATLAAAALDHLGDEAAPRRWSEMLDGPLALRRGHRPAWWWSPLGVAAGRSLDWEHAAATAIAFERGWIGDRDWSALRKRVLGAAARGSARRDDERLIAAGRLWVALVDDPAAERIVSRPAVRHDPIAVALDRLATHLRAGRVIENEGGRAVDHRLTTTTPPMKELTS